MASYHLSRIWKRKWMSDEQGEEVFSLFGRSKQDPESQPLACSPASWRLSTDGQRWWRERSLEPTCPYALLSVVEPEVYHVVFLPGIPTPPHFPMSCTCNVSSSSSSCSTTSLNMSVENPFLTSTMSARSILWKDLWWGFFYHFVFFKTFQQLQTSPEHFLWCIFVKSFCDRVVPW